MRFLLLLPLLISGLLAQDEPAADPAEQEGPASRLEFRAGGVTLPAKVARLELAEGYRYLSPSDSRIVLEEMWGNPSGTADGIQGMVLMPGQDVQSRSARVVILYYSEDGHISDADMELITPEAYLAYLQQENAKANEKLKESGRAVQELVGWCGLPLYSERTHIFRFAKRFWNEKAKRGKEETQEEECWVLGRRGMITARMVMPGGRGANTILGNTSKVAEMVQFTRGNGHEDFDPKSDRRAELPSQLGLKTAVEESKGMLSRFAKAKIPLLILIGVAILAKFGIDKFREA